MGYFSWHYAGSKKVLKVGGKGYILRPNGEKAIPTDSSGYDGYGHFGDGNLIDAHEIIARDNLSEAVQASLTPEELSSVGIALTVGNYYTDTVTGQNYSVFHMPKKIEGIGPANLNVFTGTYSDTLELFGYPGKTPNDLIRSGQWFLVPYRAQYPLKISMNPNVEYATLPASAPCSWEDMA